MPTETRIQTPLLDIACEISGPDNGRPLMLLHGWPDGVRTWDKVLPALHDAGWKTFAPWLRGYGPTRFLDDKTFRCGQVTALAQDALDLADGLGLNRFALAGHDWGARAAYAMCLLAPDRITVSSSLSVGWEPLGALPEIGMHQIQNYWYHWYMALDRGEAQLREDPKAFTRHIWDIWNPGYAFSDEEFEETAHAFTNPDWADVVLHYYRMRWWFTEPDPAYAETESRMNADPVIRVPTLMLHGGSDPCTSPDTSEGKEHLFAGPYERILLDGVGHFPQRQSPESVAENILRFFDQHA